MAALFVHVQSIVLLKKVLSSVYGGKYFVMKILFKVPITQFFLFD